MKKTYSYLIIGLMLVFLASMPFRGYYHPVSCLVKAAPIFLLAYYSFLFSPRNARGVMLTIGVIFGSIGDIWLELDREKFFVFGLGSFLIGHLFYIGHFLSRFTFSKRGLPLAALVLFFTGGMAYLLFPEIKSQKPELLVPVFVYIGVICTMAVAAILRSGVSMLSIYGSLLFLLSDSLIAISMFLVQMADKQMKDLIFGYSIMVTYYAAQFLIVRGSTENKY